MNALSNHDFALVSQPVAEWLVLRCSPGRTMALAAALKDRGAWTPTWTVSREAKHGGKRVKVVEPVIAGMVFVPMFWRYDLPELPRLPFWPMRNADATLVKVADRELGPLRKVADKPLVPAHKLPRPGQRMKVIGGPYEGHTATVIHCSQRYAVVNIEGEASPFAQRLQLPPSLLQKTMLQPEPAKRGIRHRNRT